MNGVEGQVAVVTGAGRGLGRWIALGLARAGVSVALAARTRRDVEDAAAAVQQAGARAFPIVADIRDPEQCKGLMESARGYFGRLDVLVNNAGTAMRKPGLEVTLEDFNAVVETNFRGSYFCAQAAGRIMAAQRRGSIINIASTSAILVRRSVPNSVYGPTKAAIVMMTKALAAEWAPMGVRVNCVAPGRFHTSLTARLAPPASAEQQDVLATIPMGRLGEADDIVGPVLFFASPASAYVTGQTLFVDGGRTVL